MKNPIDISALEAIATAGHIKYWDGICTETDSINETILRLLTAYKLRGEALEFYRSNPNWIIPAGKGDAVDYLCATCAIQDDGGNKATEALEKSAAVLGGKI